MRERSWWSYLLNTVVSGREPFLCGPEGMDETQDIFDVLMCQEINSLFYGGGAAEEGSRFG